MEKNDEANLMKILHHGTSCTNAIKILKLGYILSSYQDAINKKIGKKHKYYISFARSKTSGFLEQVTTVLDFDYEKLRQNQIKPVDYYHFTNNMYYRADEIEERLFTHKQFLHIKNALVGVNLKQLKLISLNDEEKSAKNIIIYCKLNKIPINVYYDNKEYLSNKKMKILTFFRELIDSEKSKTIDETEEKEVSLENRKTELEKKEFFRLLYCIENNKKFEVYHLEPFIANILRDKYKKESKNHILDTIYFWRDQKLNKVIHDKGGIDEFLTYLINGVLQLQASGKIVR